MIDQDGRSSFSSIYVEQFAMQRIKIESRDEIIMLETILLIMPGVKRSIGSGYTRTMNICKNLFFPGGQVTG